MPIHGGILDLCGAIDLAANHNRVGIDTNSGYARALRVYLQHQFPKAQDYQQLVWVMAGATNLRYEKLRDGEIDATLLNPPYSYMPSISQIGSLTAVIGDYQGLVANLNKSRLAKPAHKHLLEQFIENYHKTVNSMKHNPKATIKKLAGFYQLTNETATSVFHRLLQKDGLDTQL